MTEAMAGRAPDLDRERPEAPGAVARRPPGRPGRRVVVGAVVLASAAGALAWSLTRRPDPERLWVEAELAFHAGRWDEARSALRRIERLRRKTARDWALQAQLASAAGRTDEALAALAEIPADDPLSAQASYMAGRLERGRRRLRAAEAHYRRALAIDPGLTAARRELIYIYGVQLRRREVDSEFRALARLTRLTHHDLFTWSQTHFTTWRPDIAADLEAFLAADPDDRASRLALAEILVDQPGTEAKVQGVLRDLPRSDPDATALRVRLALNRGRLDEAEAMLSGAPEGHPALARLRGKLAMLRHDPAAAIRHYRRALSSEPYDRVTASDLGRALALVGDKAAADAYLSRVRPLDELYNLVTRVRSAERENRAPDLTRLGATCEAAGLLEEARGWYRLAIDRDPLDSRAQAALYRLDRPPDSARRPLQRASPPG
jgi:tetratricopeptide (TPR) repeat protein